MTTHLAPCRAVFRYAEGRGHDGGQPRHLHAPHARQRRRRDGADPGGFCAGRPAEPAVNELRRPSNLTPGRSGAAAEAPGLTLDRSWVPESSVRSHARDGDPKQAQGGANLVDVREPLTPSVVTARVEVAESAATLQPGEQGPSQGFGRGGARGAPPARQHSGVSRRVAPAEQHAETRSGDGPYDAAADEGVGLISGRQSDAARLGRAASRARGGAARVHPSAEEYGPASSAASSVGPGHDESIGAPLLGGRSSERT